MTDLSLVTRIVCSHKASGVRSLNSANFEEFEVEEDDMDTSLVGTSFFFFHFFFMSLIPCCSQLLTFSFSLLFCSLQLKSGQEKPQKKK